MGGRSGRWARTIAGQLALLVLALAAGFVWFAGKRGRQPATADFDPDIGSVLSLIHI